MANAGRFQTASRVAEYYDAVARAYLDIYLNNSYYRFLYQRIAEVLNSYIRPGFSVLDVGAGVGFWSAYLMGRGAKVYSLDISVESLRRCPICDRAAADAARLPIGRRRFDAVVALGSVYNHLPSLEEPLQAAAAALRGGGVLIADLDNAICLDMFYERLFQRLRALGDGALEGAWETADGRSIPFYYYSYFHVVKALKAAGLRLVEARPIYLAALIPTRLQQRRARLGFLRIFDALPLAQFATSAIYVAEKPESK